MRKMLEALSEQLGLGAVLKTQSVPGGYMHKMVCVETETGKYAVKLLNPKIMKRPDVFENYQTAERLEKVLELNGLPVVAALEFFGQKMQCVGHQYCYVFDWIEGKALGANEIEKGHCEQIGALLARIHKLELKKEPFAREASRVDWDAYIQMAAEACPEIAALLLDSRELLYAAQNKASTAFGSVPALMSICNGDMDSKNVLWIGGKPNIIDLECLAYGNPYLELFQLALYWSGYERCRIDYALLNAFISAYSREYGCIQVDWEVLFHSNCGSLEWLEYSVKRALMIECADDAERQLGIEQARETMKRIIYYHSVKDELLGRIRSMTSLPSR